MIGVLSVLILILIGILISYKRQVKDICRQLRFLQECDSNMLITTEMKKGHIGELVELLNTLLKERKKERADYQKKEQMIADIYTNLSHDIRTPLTSLDGYFQLLEETQEENDRKRYIQIIQERIESLKEMLEELFTYTKLQNGTYELKMCIRDSFQIVLSNRLSAPFEGSLLNTYRVLRTINPSPYMFYFSGTDVEVAGASPETLVKLENGVLHTFPLAGTRPRGKNDEEDKALETELLADEKELAEHNMLVDLGRNDLGKISKFGTVQVEKLHSVERFSHVMHIGSTVRGEITEKHDALDRCV